MTKKIWNQIADILHTTITEEYGKTDEADAGVAFANGYNIQVSPYIKDVYSIWREDGDTFEVKWHGKTQKAMLEFVKTLAVNSYKVGIRAVGEKSFYSNSIRLQTEEQAKAYGIDLWSRWSQAEEWKVVPSNDPANHTADEHGRLTRIASSEEA